jgi:hypothetical protein
MQRDALPAVALPPSSESRRADSAAADDRSSSGAGGTWAAAHMPAHARRRRSEEVRGSLRCKAPSGSPIPSSNSPAGGRALSAFTASDLPGAPGPRLRRLHDDRPQTGKVRRRFVRAIHQGDLVAVGGSKFAAAASDSAIRTHEAIAAEVLAEAAEIDAAWLSRWGRPRPAPAAQPLPARRSRAAWCGPRCRAALPPAARGSARWRRGS